MQTAAPHGETEILEYIHGRLAEMRCYEQTARRLEYDRETSCPFGGKEAAGEAVTALRALAFSIRKEPGFEQAVLALYNRMQAAPDGVSDFRDRCLIEGLRREILHNHRITPEQQLKRSRILETAWLAWARGVETGEEGACCRTIAAVLESERERVLTWEPADAAEETSTAYDRMLSEYERGLTESRLEALFSECAGRIGHLLEEIRESQKTIRTDFLAREATEGQQQQILEYLLDLMGFDRSRGTWSLSEHPFTEILSRDDVRITSHFVPGAFLSSFYSVMHECGHALFEQLQPRDDYDRFIEDRKTMGMHESVSRFYENVIGRSESFIHLIYPKLREIFPQVLYDVTETELYEAVNAVQPSLIRTDADELTYTLHVIIRFEIERALVSGALPPGELSAEWRRQYARVLGVTPENARDGLLQDNHWTRGFSYFPTYALGNLYNAMYVCRMRQDFDLDAAVAAGDFTIINRWMAEHVFLHANHLTADEWIRDITGRALTAEDFLTYLESKYRKLYGISDGDSSLDSAFRGYARRMRTIRLLSSPQLDGVDNADAFRSMLSGNFQRIGNLAQKNRGVLRDELFPLLHSEQPLAGPVIQRIRSLNETLMDPYAPYLAELLGQEEVLADLRFLLEEGRQETYRDAWHLLKGVQDARFK